VELFSQIQKPGKFPVSMPGKRKRTIKYTTKRLIRKYVQRARKQGTKVSLYRNVSNRLRRLESTVETKEYTWRTSANVALPQIS